MGAGRKKVVGPRPYQPLPLRGPCSLLHYMEYEVRVGNNRTCTSNPQQWGRKRSKRKKIHQPGKTKNMKVKKTRAGLQILEEAGRLNRSAFDPRAPGFQALKMKIGRK